MLQSTSGYLRVPAAGCLPLGEETDEHSLPAYGRQLGHSSGTATGDEVHSSADEKSVPAEQSLQEASLAEQTAAGAALG